MFAIAGVSGHTGKVVADTLLAQSVPVRVIVRDAQKGAEWKAKGAEVAVADMKDAKALAAAFRGAKGAFVLSPPNLAAPDVAKNARENLDALKAAIIDSGLPHLVLLSSVGAQLPSGTGPIAHLHVFENELSQLKAHVSFLRAGYFMENLLQNLHPMKTQSVLPAMLPADRKIGMVATPDIGAVAAELLRAGTTAPKVVELAGPQDRTLAEAAEVFSKVMGKSIALAPVPPAAQYDVLRSVGLNDGFARLYAEMNAAFGEGRVKPETAPRRGVITLERFVELALR